MKKKLISILLILVMASALLGGCKGKEEVKTSDSKQTTDQPKDQSKEVPAEEATDASDAEPVTLRFAWWGSDARHEATLKAIEKYTDLHPNVTIEGEYQGYDGYQQKLMTQIAGQTEPDLMQLDYIWYPDLSAQGDVFVDMSTDANVDLSVYSDSILSDYCSIDGKVIALPMGTNGFGIMINTKFFEKHNIPLDTV